MCDFEIYFTKRTQNTVIYSTVEVYEVSYSKIFDGYFRID